MIFHHDATGRMFYKCHSVMKGKAMRQAWVTLEVALIQKEFIFIAFYLISLEYYPNQNAYIDEPLFAFEARTSY